MKKFKDLVSEYRRNKCKQERCTIKSSFKNFKKMLAVISIGKVGFRNWGWEEALVRNVKVMLQA